MESVRSWYTEFFIKILTCTEFVPSVLNDKQKEKCVDIREHVKLITSNPRVPEPLMTCDETWNYCYDPDIT